MYPKPLFVDGILERVGWCREYVHLVRPFQTHSIIGRLNDPSGDSWSDIGFDTSGPLPNPGNPFGNPIFPKLNASYGAEWPVYLATENNCSVIETYTLAKASSVVNNVIDPQRPDLVHQVHQEFLPLWGKRNDSTWQPSNTLFIFFIGTNDVGVTVESKFAMSGTFDNLFWSYSVLVDQVSSHFRRLKTLCLRCCCQLYQAGARNFLFMNVAPLDRVPIPMANVGPAVDDWNKRLSQFASQLSSAQKNTTVFQFDTHSLFGQVLANVSSFPTTSQLKNLTGTCPLYNWIYKDMFDPSCGVPLSEFLWLNNLHPTYPIHATIAAQVAKTLGG